MDAPILIIKQQYFNEILAGTKKEEYRSLSDFNAKLFCEKEGDEYAYFKPIERIKLAVGYRKDRDWAIVEVKDIYIAEFQNEIPDGFQKGDECFVIELGNIAEKYIKN